MSIHLLATSTSSESQLYQNWHSATSFIWVALGRVELRRQMLRQRHLAAVQRELTFVLHCLLGENNS
jgi:hypothetical protein